MFDIPKSLKIIIVGIVFIVDAIKLLYSNPTGAIFLVKGASSKMEIPLLVTITEITPAPPKTPSAPTVNLKVTIKNTSPSPVSFLRWSTPLDPRASAMGIFVFTSQQTGIDARFLDLKINRKLPESGVFGGEEVATIEAGGQLGQSVEIKAPEVLLQASEKYLVRATGNWMYVKIGDDATMKTEDGDALRGDFESNLLEFQVPG